MSDLYLKADNEAELMYWLSAAGLVTDGVVQVCGAADVYVTGTLYKDEQPLHGFHANVRTDDPEIIAKLEPISCEVSSPSFVFA